MKTSRRCLILTMVALTCLSAADPEGGRKADLAAGAAAVAKREFGAAKAAFEAALADATQAKDEAAILETTRRLAGLHRLQGSFAEAEVLLERATATAARAFGDTSEELAATLSELAMVQRAQRKLQPAMLTLDSCVRTREAAGSKTADRVRDISALARVYLELDDADRALKRWNEALGLWDASMPQDSPEILGVIDALAGLQRDRAEYETAEALLRRALTIRESIFGPEGSELISTLDSAAYVLFGQKKYAEAEVFYKRLLAAWRASATPDHPMVALTLEKMAEFYSAQDRYAESEPLLVEALAIRSSAQLRAMHQAGRLLVGQLKFAEAERLYRKAVRLGDESGMPDEFMDPLLRMHSTLLKELNQTAEAAALDKRVKEGIARSQKLRPSPVKMERAR